MDERLARYLELNSAMVVGRKVILAGHVLAGATKLVEGLFALGATDCFILASAIGTGPLPDDSVGRFVLGIEAPNLSVEIQRTNRTLADLPADARAALDEFDHNGDALVLTLPFLDPADIGGRVAYGARPPEWARIEDKTAIDALFDRCRVVRPGSRVVPVSAHAIAPAVSDLDRGDGTVWAGDIRDGFHGGGDLVRWVRGSTEVEQFTEWFRERCDHVRIAPFLEGIPCSVHGFVCDDGIAAFRPMEMVILRRPDDHPDRSRFVYAGMASMWDPEPEDREVMREVARRVGRLLDAEVAYRGAFTVDGIMTADGFLPTEMNPRYGGALNYVNGVLPRLGLPLLHIRATAGDGQELRSAELEALVVEAGDATRWGSSHTMIPMPCEETSTFALPGLGTLTVGPAVAGTLVRIEPDLDAVVRGPSFAPRAIEGFEYAERELGIPIGPLTAARSVR
jgi:hypothetical protein